MRMKFKGASDAQAEWGGNEDPRKFMSVGDVVTLVDKEVHDWHTKLIFKEYPGKKFNSVCFDPV